MRCLLSLLLVFASCTCRSGSGAPDSGSGPDPDWLAGRVVTLPASPQSGGSLTVRLPLEPSGLTRLHDRFNEGSMTRITVGPLYETLGRVRDGKLEALLAQSWAESDDHLTLTIKVRQGVSFHDGKPLSSADVKATLDAVFEPKKRCLATAREPGLRRRRPRPPLRSQRAPRPRRSAPRRALSEEEEEQVCVKPTPLQQTYLQFIRDYIALHRQAPAEADMQAFFRVSPPSVHRMVVVLAEKGLITRMPGQARSIRLVEGLPVPPSPRAPLTSQELEAAADTLLKASATRRGRRS